MTELGFTLGNAEAVATYIGRQVEAVSPTGQLSPTIDTLVDVIAACSPAMTNHLRAVRAFEDGVLDVFNSLQHAAFIYMLSREAARRDDPRLADRLFLLNKAYNGIDLYHRVQLPEIFFLSHGIGSVLGACSYDTHLVVFQNVTVGRVGERRPAIGPRVVLFPGASVTGSSVIGANSVVSANVAVHNTVVPADTLVSAGADGVTLTPLRRDYCSLYFVD